MSGTTSARRRKLLQAGPFGYFAGGASDEWTLRREPRRVPALELRPRMLVDVEPSTATTVARRGGRAADHRRADGVPAAGAPRGRGRDRARAAAAGTIMSLSTIGDRVVEEVAAAPRRAALVPALRLPRPRRRPRLRRRGRGRGYRAIVLTVDRPCSAAASATSAPAGSARDDPVPALVAALGAVPEATSRRPIHSSSPPLSWRDVERLAGRSRAAGARQGHPHRRGRDARRRARRGGDRRLEPRRPTARRRRRDARHAAGGRRRGRRARRRARRRRDPARHRRRRRARARRTRRPRRPRAVSGGLAVDGADGANACSTCCATSSSSRSASAAAARRTT